MTGKKVKKDSAKAKDTEAEKDATEANEATEGEEEFGNIRDRMRKDIQEEIRLEERNEKGMSEFEAKEAAIRESQLEKSSAVISRHWTAYEDNVRVLEQKEQWERYMTCDGLPDPGSLPDMNAFVYLWSIEEEQASIDTVEEKCRVVTRLLTKLEQVVRFSTVPSDEYRVVYEEVRVPNLVLPLTGNSRKSFGSQIGTELRKRLQRWIDLACYRLLRNIERNMIRENTKTSRYVRASNNAVCCFWVPIVLPVGMKRPTGKEPEPIQVRFDEIEMSVRMPVDVDCHRMAIRGLWLAYDHYSIETRSHSMPKLPDHLLQLWDRSLGLLEFARREHQEKLRIWEEQAEERRLRLEEKKAMLERLDQLPAVLPTTDKRSKRGKKKRPGSARKQEELDAILASILPSKAEMLPNLPTPNEILRRKEDEIRLEARRSLFTRCEKTEVNLRKYRILGGVFRLDLLHQPAQPKDLGKDTYLTTVELPKEAKFVAFSRRYVTPQPTPDSERTPEAIEAEMKAHEAAMEALVLITIRLPDSIVWFEPPIVAQWIPEKEIWSNQHVHDVKYNEEQQTIAFRTGRLGVHGLAAYKFFNLPFQSWELKPESGKNGREYGGVVLAVTAATIQAEFLVREDRVSLHSITGPATNSLKRMLDEYYQLERLIERLQLLGCDLFPDRDAIAYLTGINAKHPVTENHLLRCMAMLSTTYTFAWSRWNASRHYRQIVLQFKEVHGCVAKEHTNFTLLVTPSRTMRVRCTEVGSEFSDLPYDEQQDSKYYADLYQLALDTAGIKTRLSMERISYKLVTTVARLLERTNVIGLSS